MPLLDAHAAALLVIPNPLADSAEPELLQLSLKSLNICKKDARQDVKSIDNQPVLLILLWGSNHQDRVNWHR